MSPADTIILNLSTLSTIMPFLLCVVVRLLRRSFPKDLNWFCGILFLSVLLEVALSVFRSSDTNIWLIHLSTPIEFVLVMLFLYSLDLESSLNKVILYLIPAYLVAFILLQVVEIEFLQTGKINVFTGPLFYIIAASLSLWYLMRLAYNVETSLIRDYRFWILAGLMQFYAMSVIIFSLMTFTHLTDFLLWIGRFNLFSNLLHNLLFSVALLFAYKHLGAAESSNVRLRDQSM